MADPADLEAQRILRAYKRLVLLGRARLALAEGRALVGPDCAFHLYFRSRPPARARRAKRTKARRRSPARPPGGGRGRG